MRIPCGGADVCAAVGVGPTYCRYDENRLYCILFIIYLIVALYVFISILLAVVYENYRKSMRLEIREERANRRRNLARAFEILKDEETDTITYAQWEQLLAKVKPDSSSARTWLLWLVLDQNEDGFIGVTEFSQVSPALGPRPVTNRPTQSAANTHTRCLLG